MATPMTASQTKAQMKKWGVNATYLAGWENRGRNHLPFSNVNGIMIHHTGSDSQSKDYVDWLFKQGRPKEGIPAPLAQAMAMMDGRLVIGAKGRANHAGKGMNHVLEKVIAETTPLNSEIKPGGIGSVDGNARFYGNEVAYDGGQPMTKKQYAALIRWCAAICDFHGWTGRSIIGHGEWTSAKWDPGQCAVDQIRRDVNALLKAGPGTGAKPEPAPVKLEGWFSLRTVNVWGNSTEGAANFDERVPGLAKDIATGKRHIVGVQELRKDQEPLLTAELRKYGYRLARHSSLLALYVRENSGVVVHATKVVMLATQNKGWEERVLLVDMTIRGARAIVGVAHLDYRDGFDAGRVAQGKEAFAALDAWGEERGVKQTARFLIGDMNSNNWVTDKAAEPAGYEDSFAKVRKNPKRIDFIYPSKGRPVRNAWQTKSKWTDHQIQTAIVQRAAAA